MVKVIAEIGSVHDGSFGNACCLIQKIAEAGAWAVKFQLHIAKEETTINAPNPNYFKSESRYDYFERTAFSENQWRELKEISHKNKLKFIVSPFSIEAAKRLIELDIDYFKIPSGEVTNLPLLELIGQHNIPSILSSGMSSLKELNIAKELLGKGLKCIMQCTSEYPCRPENVGLNLMNELAAMAEVSPGFSDHTMGPVASIIATSKGAEFIEKHITFSRSMYGSDAKHSMTIEEFKVFMDYLNQASIISNSDIDKDIKCLELNEMKMIFEKSLVYKRDFNKGHNLLEEDLDYKKPGTGISPSNINKIIGRKLLRSVRFDEQVKLSDLKE